MKYSNFFSIFGLFFFKAISTANFFKGLDSSSLGEKIRWSITFLFWYMSYDLILNFNMMCTSIYIDLDWISSQIFIKRIHILK